MVVTRILAQFGEPAIPPGPLLVGIALVGSLVLPARVLRWWTPFSALAGAIAVLLLSRPSLGAGIVLPAVLSLVLTAYLVAVTGWCRVDRAQHAALLLLAAAAALAPESGVPWELRVAAVAAAGLLSTVSALVPAAPGPSVMEESMPGLAPSHEAPSHAAKKRRAGAAALAGLKHIIFVVFGSLCLLVAYALAGGLAIYGELAASPAFIVALSLVGLIAWLALGPFCLWWWELAEHVSAPQFGALIVNSGPAVAVLVLQLWQRYPHLAPEGQAAALSMAGGALTSLVGGWSLYAARTSGQRLAGLWLLTGGFLLCGLATETPAGVGMALAALAVTQVAAALLAASAGVAEGLPPGSYTSRMVGSAEACALAVVAGLPPFPGFAILAATLQAALQVHWGAAIAIGTAVVLAGAAALRAAGAAMLMPRANAPAGIEVPSSQRLRLALLLLPATAVLALGFLPAPLIATFTAVATRLRFVH